MFQRDLSNLDFIAEQRKKTDAERSLFGESDIRSPVTNVHVLECERKARKKAYSHLAGDLYFHHKGFRGSRLNPVLVGIGVHQKKQRHYDEDEESGESAEDDFE